MCPSPRLSLSFITNHSTGPGAGFTAGRSASARPPVSSFFFSLGFCWNHNCLKKGHVPGKQLRWHTVRPPVVVAASALLMLQHQRGTLRDQVYVSSDFHVQKGACQPPAVAVTNALSCHVFLVWRSCNQRHGWHNVLFIIILLRKSICFRLDVFLKW